MSSSAAPPAGSSSSSASPSASASSPPSSPSSKPLISEVVKAGEADRRRHAKLEPELPSSASSSSLLSLVNRVNQVLIKALVVETRTGGRVDSITINIRKSANTLLLVKEILLPQFTKEELLSVFVLNSTNSLTKLENGSLVMGGRGGVILEWCIGGYISMLIADYFTMMDRQLAHDIVDHQAKTKLTAKDLTWH